jgi:transcription-repair coupling factor (superfamily II helicase)
MSVLRDLLGVLARDPNISRWVAAARDHTEAEQSLTAPSGLVGFLAALTADADHGDRPVLLVTASVRDCEDRAAHIAALLPEHSVAVFPPWETLPHERLSPSADVVGQRLTLLRRLHHPEESGEHGPVRVVVAPVRALMQPVDAELGNVEPINVAVGTEYDLDRLTRELASLGYSRTDLVERRGEFAVRGGIVDVFPATAAHPVRVEFFGDDIEQIRTFAVSDQRSIEELTSAWIPPCRELLFTDDVRERARQRLADYPQLSELLSAVAEGVAIPGVEAVAPLVATRMVTLPQLLPADTVVVVADPTKVTERADELLVTAAEFLAAGWDVAAGGGEVPVELSESGFAAFAELAEESRQRGQSWWQISPFTMADSDDSAAPLAMAVATPAPRLHGDLQALMAFLRDAAAHGATTLLTAVGPGSAQRIAETLAEEGLNAAIDPEHLDAITITTGPFDRGFVASEVGVGLLTEADIWGISSESAAPQKMPSRRRRGVDPLSLQAGDHVVHEQHGVGRYVELVERQVGGSTREYLVIEYAASKRGQPADRLFVPTDQLDQVTRYVGGEAPTLHRLGGSDWQQAKGSARRAVRQIVDGLVKLYATRQQTKGRAFGPDTAWQRELEEAFPFTETPDQLACIDEVKADMVKPVPMDRVICGDVGFGKTEIAIRAAFKAVADGAQVVVLVPTTLLARQHLRTFQDRFAGFPVKVAGLSRFTNDAQAKEVLAGIADGTVDVVVATHRILSAKATFHDLGLVIIDEEQRFGVEHKEHLKALRTNVDVLAMSATPIPRTLEMAVTGIREMSTIATPPEDRLPVLTFVGPYNDKQVAAAIRREMARDGQVFFVHNRVASINKVAARIRELVPEAEVVVAHGQMSENRLEQVMVDFWERRADVLVSTTIVESGLDIPNANTLIVDRAENFGLSQLHQIRGRVGRGRERAYAYFFFNDSRPLTETAYERLSTIAGHTDLGAGMAVAMKDLEIRGAGNLLGDEQSGHIADVGFDLYVRMVGEALAEFKGETTSERAPARVELPLNAHIPHSYIPDERLRLEAYRRLAQTVDGQGIDEVLAELTDRYGRPPQPVLDLAAAAGMRHRLEALGITEVVASSSRIRIEGLTLPESLQLRLQRLYPGCVLKPASRTVLLPQPKTARVGGKPLTGEALVTWLEEFIQAVDSLVPSRSVKEET